MADDILFSMKNIRKEFGPVVALDEVNINVRRGSIHAICGENGAGKSTLMNVLSGVYPYGSYTGDIYFDGELKKFHSLRDSEKDGIVIIHQELALSPYLSIAENIFLGNERKGKIGIDWHRTTLEAKKIMDTIGLHEDPEAKIFQIGVGKQQLVEIAKAMTKDLKLLILDEPTSALNDEDSAHLLGLVDKLRKEHGVTAVFITHKLNEVAMIADDVTVIRDGKTVGEIPVSRPDNPLDEDKLIALMVGRTLENRFPSHTAHPGETLFEVSNWNVYHPVDANRKVVDGVSIDVKAGEIVGLAGLMGAGRTEFAMSVFGRSYGAKISGEIKVNGQVVDLKSVDKAIKAGIGYVSEDRKTYGLNLLQNIRENTAMAALRKLVHFGVIDGNKEINEAEKLRKDLRTKTPSIEALVSTLSGGNQQKVVFSKWVFADPNILILDEPTRGIDVGAKFDIYEIINRLADEGRAIVVISSELPELLGICDRIYTISFGRVTGSFEKKDSDQETLMRYMTKEKESL